MKDEYFVPENAKCSSEHLSPSGQYKLKVTSFTTGKGTWNYTQGLVYRKDSDEPIAEVRRNYSAFPFLFVEDHPNGHQYLVCGEDYQGQTVLELDTGKRWSHLPPEAKEGHGFCWAGYEFNRETQTLVVDGCYWACPYEFRFYDFSDPSKGWPLIELKDSYIDVDKRVPTFNADGTITTYQTESDDDVDDDEDETKLRPIAATKIFRREGLQLVLVEEIVTDKEKERRAASEASRRKWEEFWDTYKKSDPLYTTMKADVEADPFFETAEKHISTGWTYKNWWPGHEIEESRVCRDIYRKGDVRIEINIAVKTGPVKLDCYRKQEHSQSFFDHTVEGVKQALAAAKAFVGAS